MTDYMEKEKKLANLYQTVPRSTLISVYRRYKFDYELFGYDFNEALKLAGYQKLSQEEEETEPLFHN